jgi:hypothetical protein
MPASCPNCGRRTQRTKDWVCEWCGYPLLYGNYKQIDKTYKELQEERSSSARSYQSEGEPDADYAEEEEAPEPEPPPPPPKQPLWKIKRAPRPTYPTRREPEPEPEYPSEPESRPTPAPRPRYQPTPPPRTNPEPMPPLQPMPPIQPRYQPAPPAQPRYEPAPAPASQSEPEPLLQPRPEPTLLPPSPQPAQQQPIITPPPLRMEPAPQPRMEVPPLRMEPPPRVQPPPPPPPPSQEPVYLPSLDSIKNGTQLTIDQLDALFRSDNVGTNEALKEKTIIIKGIVNKVFIRDHLDIRYMILNGARKVIWSARCQFEKEAAGPIGRLAEGQAVALRGKYDGYGKNIIFKNCELVAGGS